MNRYSPAFVTLHWLSASLIIVLLCIGHIMPQRLHILIGALVGVMFIIRLFLKSRLVNSRPASAKNNVTETLITMAHNIIYGLLFAVVISGIGVAINLFFHNSVGMNENMLVQSLHHWLTNVLLGVISIHVIAALFHQFILKDQLISRMWFNSRMKVSHVE